MDKVFCSECKHFDWGICYSNPDIKSTPMFRERITYHLCERKNKRNNCKDFELKDRLNPEKKKGLKAFLEMIKGV